MKRHSSERSFGFQIATKSADEAIAAVRLAQEAGVDFVDLNVGCPIFEATRRGLGAELLKRPDALCRLVALTTQEIGDVPFTVKVRLGPSDSKINADRVVEGLTAAGAAAVTVHGRTMTQRYTRPADWATISRIGRERGRSPGAVPLIGNGDVLTWYEAQDRLALGGIDALMVGRGALIKPWIFAEYAEGRSIEPTSLERVRMLFRLTSYFKDHFGPDDFGKRHAFYFLPWHFEFLCRYRPLPEDVFRPLSRQLPLIQNSRLVDDALHKAGLFPPSSKGSDGQADSGAEGLLERVLRSEDPAVHLAVSEALWAAESSEEAIDSLLAWGAAAEGERRGAGAEWGAEPGARGGESSWQVGGAGPRGDNSSAAAAVTSRRPRSESSRWQPVSIATHLSLLEIRVGRVVSSLPHPGAETLMVNEVDCGSGGGVRCVVTGRRSEVGDSGGAVGLEGLLVAVVCNLKPRTLLNVTSDGLMLFAHSDQGGLEGRGRWAPITAPPGEAPGALLSFFEAHKPPGHKPTAAAAAAATPTRASRAWKECQPSLKVVGGEAVAVIEAGVATGPLCSLATGKTCSSVVLEGVVV